jgi:hypothetical protein
MCIPHGQDYDHQIGKKRTAKGAQHVTDQFGVQGDLCGACERGPVYLAGKECAYFGLSKGSPQNCSA